MGRDAHFIENNVRSLQNIPSLTQRDKDIILGTVLGVSRGISDLSREIPNPGIHVESRPVTVDPFKYALHQIARFLFCIDTEVLSIFLKDCFCVFLSELVVTIIKVSTYLCTYVPLMG